MRSDVEIVAGGSAGDTITGSSGADVLFGNGGADTLDGGGGARVLGRHLGLEVDHRQRSLELVRGHGRELALGGDTVLDAIEHPVDRVGEIGDLVVGTGVVDALIE